MSDKGELGEDAPAAGLGDADEEAVGGHDAHTHSESGRATSRSDTDKAPERSKRNRRPPAVMGITVLVLAGVWLLWWLIGKHFSVTLFAASASLAGMMWYTYIRRRSPSDGIIFYSHNQILYYWPIWLGSFVMSDITELFGQHGTVSIGDGKAMETMLSTPGMSLFFLVVIALVIFFTSVNIRGVWAVVLGVSVITSGLLLSVFDWWPYVLGYLGGLTLYVNTDFYTALGIVLFVPWFVVVFVFDMRRYFHFMPAQITMVNEIGEGEKSFDSMGVVMEKQRDNFVQHMALGFGSGDLIITTSGGQRDIITFPNVLRINKVLDEIQAIRERRGRDLI